MFGILKSAVILGLLFLLVSCGMLSGSKKRAEQPLHDTQKLVDPATGKEVVFIWMQHLSSESGYAEIRAYLDRMKEEGYVTFSESIIARPFHIDTVGEVTMRQLQQMERAFSKEDSLRQDTLLRKCRRMLGFMLTPEGYADTTNVSLPEKIRKEYKGYVSQTEERLGLTTDKDIWVDYSLRDITEVCERRYGEIPLTDYDLQTGLLEKYAPEEPSPQHMRSYYILFARNDYLVRRIAESPRPKIVVVYGAGHSFGVLWQLKKFHNYKPDRQFKVQ